MSQFNRRGFMRTLLVTAVGAVPAHVALPAIPPGPLLIPAFPLHLGYGNGPQSFASPNRLTLAFQNFLRINNEWKPATFQQPVDRRRFLSLITSQVNAKTREFNSPVRAKQKVRTVNPSLTPGFRNQRGKACPDFRGFASAPRFICPRPCGFIRTQALSRKSSPG